MRCTTTALTCLCACSFSNKVGDNDMPTVDAATDGATDAPLTACNVKPTGAPVVAGMVGPGGGSTRDDVVCAAGEFPIGFDFRYYDPIVATHVRCGTLTRADGGAITTTPAERVGDSGLHGTCIIGSSIDDVPEQLCPSGHVLVGIAVNNISSSYNSFSMQCQPLTATMQISGSMSTVAFPQTGSDATNESAACGPGMAIVSFGLKSGCDQEQLVVRCTQVTCE